jgi:3-mercaptopyruvate sulfurtransferase SseA
LLDKGFKRVRPLEGGLEAWVAAGHEVTMYDQPLNEKGEQHEVAM